MREYLMINIFTVIFPLLYSFESSIRFYKKFKSVFYSSLVVGIPFVAWDIIATMRGDWSFNSKYLIGVTVFNLPLEEILFFVTVPYSMIFLYEIAKKYLSDFEIDVRSEVLITLSFLFILFGAFNHSRDYTFSVSIAMGVFFFVLLIMPVKLKNSFLFWLYMLLAFVPFIIVNYFLTSLPVVLYNPEAFFNLRITTIPIEDFFYSFSLVGTYIIFYEYFSFRFSAKEKEEK